MEGGLLTMTAERATYTHERERGQAVDELGRNGLGEGERERERNKDERITRSDRKLKLSVEEKRLLRPANAQQEMVSGLQGVQRRVGAGRWVRWKMRRFTLSRGATIYRGYRRSWSQSFAQDDRP
jgi:hypothetical protein